YGIMGFDSQTKLGEAVNFFIYDTTKIVILLFAISAVMGVINAYFPTDRLRDYLNRHKLYGFQYLMASLFGAVTPFCSCSSIPLFIGFVKGGIPLGVTFSFLITSPLVNEVAVAMFLGTFGAKATAIYVASGILLGSVGGAVLELLHLEPLLTPWVRKLQKQSNLEQSEWQTEKVSFFKRLPSILKESWRIVKGVLVYVIIGIAIGAGIHGFVPENFFSGFLGGGQWWTVPLAVILAVPMYSNAAGVIPLIEAFVSKGVALGTAIAFMMAVVGLSLPEATMLKKVMTWKLIAIFFGTVTMFIIISGWIFNWLI
ncbi:MAG: permease, partial [Bacteroidales bacterium]|nr:permease [Bacteroidales bacterium]